jgi:hypothetical protein
MISDKQFLKFHFHPKMISFKPKKRKKYDHHVIVASKNKLIPASELRDLAIGVLSNDEKSTKDFADFFTPEFQLDFSNENNARDAEKALGLAKNDVLVQREKKEIMSSTEEGIIYG